MAKGRLCQTTAEDRTHFNSSEREGQCTSSCRCEPQPRDARLRQHHMFVLNLADVAEHREVKTERELRELPFELSLPAAGLRRADKCERFERQSYAWTRVASPNPDDQCKLTCTVSGHFGNVMISLPERALNRNQRDGSYCQLKVAETEDVAAFGVKQSVVGQCKQGVCVPSAEVKILHFNEAPVSTVVPPPQARDQDPDEEGEE